MGSPENFFLKRREARALGLQFYTTGKPCARGHYAPRYANEGNCTACKAEDNAKFNRKKRYRADGTMRPGARRHKLLKSAKKRALEKGVAFSLKTADVKWPTICPALGIPLEYDLKHTSDSNPSLDRFVPSLGYVPGNVYVISRRANMLKSNSVDPAELRAVADWMERIMIEEVWD